MSATGQDTAVADTNSVATFTSALVTAAITVSVYTVLFWFLHSRFQSVFQPRSERAPEAKRPEILPKSFFGWWKAIFTTPDIRAGEMNGADAYFFLRFMKFLSIVLLPFWLLTWIILMPIHSVSPTNGSKGLDKFTFGNIAPSKNIRHVADLLVVISLIFWTLFMLHREFKAFTRIRQAYLNSPAHATLARSRTVMVNNLPKGWENEERLRELAGFTGGRIEAIWIARDVKKLNDVFEARNKEVLKLEAAEAKVQTLAAKNVEKNNLPLAPDAESANPLAKYVPVKKLPTHRTGPLGLIGSKKQTLTWSPQFIRERNEELDTKRAQFDSFPVLRAAFIRFSKQSDAHLFASRVKKQSGAKLVNASVEVVPEDIIWPSLGMSPIMRKIRTFISWALTIGLIIVWTIPIAFVGTVSKIKTVCDSVSFLSWICTLPAAVTGIIQGILPPVLMAVLFLLLPIVLRIFVKLQGEARRSDVERKLFSRFWAFQVVHGLIIVAFASGLIPIFSNFDELKKTTGQIPTILAQTLPKSSTYFLTFIMINTFTKAAATISRAVPVVMSKLAFIFRGKTPRKAFEYDYKLDSIALATTWPPLALLGTIAITYTMMQPLVLGFASVGLFLLYATYKYLLIWVVDQPDALETGGLYYVKGLRTVFVSLYLLELSSVGLFFLLPNSNGQGRSPIGIGCGIVMAVMIGITAAAQIWMEMKFRKHYLYLDSSGFKHGAPSAEALWPNMARGGDAMQAEGTMNLNSDLIAQQQARHGAGEEYGNTTGLHSNAFDHPALWKSQPVVWIANDTLGLGRWDTGRLSAEKVEASTEYASMDEKGKIVIERGPPDEAWYGGKTSA